MGSTQSKNHRLDKILDKYNLVENFQTRECSNAEARAGWCCDHDNVYPSCTDQNPLLCPSQEVPDSEKSRAYRVRGKLCCIDMNCNHGSLSTTIPCTCQCDPGWHGVDCTEQDEVPCDRGPDGNDNPVCSGHGNANGNRTRDPNGDYSNCACNCDAGWEGDNCETEQTRPCTTGPDGNSASICSGEGTASGTYSPGPPADYSTCQCTCVQHFAGPNCEHSDDITCNSHGVAQPDGTCRCDQNYEGDNCEQGAACTTGPDGRPCVNGTPDPQSVYPNCECNCDATHEGDHCETPIACQASDSQAPGYYDCHYNDNHHNVATGDVVNGCGCQCQADYRGDRCQDHFQRSCNDHGTLQGACSDPSFIDQSTCEAAGHIWTDNANCICDAGWAPDGAPGANVCNQGVCQDSDQHGPHYIDCKNGSTLNQQSSPPNCSCNCPPGWDGDDCSIGVCQASDQHEANYIECQHNGVVNPQSSPPNCSCTCTQGWHGDHCDLAQEQSCNSVDLGNGPVPIGWDASTNSAVACQHSGDNENRNWTLNAQGQPDYSTCGDCDCAPDAQGQPMYEGAACDSPVPCTLDDIVLINPDGCENGGQLDTSKTRVDGCVCDCTATDYEGNFCESGCQTSDPAAAGYVDCQHGGTATGTLGNCKCTNCPRTYTGDYCNTRAIRPCTDASTNPQSPDVICNHGSATGTALLGLDVDGSQDDTTGCSCTCNDGWEGDDCNTHSTCHGAAADGQRCQNGGTAQRHSVTHECVCACPAGFVGDHCEMTQCEFDALSAGTCSVASFSTQATCEAAGNTWTGGLESAICYHGRCAPADSLNVGDPATYCDCNQGWQKGDGEVGCRVGYDSCANAETNAQAAGLSGFCEGGTASPHTSQGGLTDCRCSCPPRNDGQGNTIHSHLVSGSGATERAGALADPTAIDARCVDNCPTDCSAGDTRAGCCNPPNGNCDGSTYPPSCVCTPESGMQGPNCSDGRDFCAESANGGCGETWQSRCDNNTCVCEGRWTKAADAAAMEQCNTLTRACENGTPIDCGPHGTCVDGYATLAVTLEPNATTITVAPAPPDSPDTGISSFVKGRNLDGETPINGQLIIQNELINYSGINVHDNQFLNCTRAVSFGSFDSAPTRHLAGSAVVEHNPRCQCVDGYSGTLCTTAPSVCAGLGCKTNSTCVVDPGNGVARCQCTNGYSGTRCHIPPDSCNYPINYICGICSDGISTSPQVCTDAGGEWTSTGTKMKRADGSCYCSCEAGYHGDMCELTTSTCVDPAGPSTPKCIGGTCSDASFTTQATCETAGHTWTVEERDIRDNEMCAFNGVCRCKVGYTRNTSQQCEELTACNIPGSIIEPFELESVGDGQPCDNGRGTTRSEGNSCICVCNTGSKDQDGKCTRDPDLCSDVDAHGVRTPKCTGRFQTCNAATGQCECPANYAFHIDQDACVPSTDACSQMSVTQQSCAANNRFVRDFDADGTALTGYAAHTVSTPGVAGSVGCGCVCDGNYRKEGGTGHCLIPPTASTGSCSDGVSTQGNCAAAGGTWTSCSAEIACGICSDGSSTSQADCAAAGGHWTSTGAAYYLPAGTCSDGRSTTQTECENSETGGTCSNGNHTTQSDCTGHGEIWTPAQWNSYSHLDICPGGGAPPCCVCACNSNYSGAHCTGACEHLLCENGTKTLRADGSCACECNAGWEDPQGAGRTRCDIPLTVCSDQNPDAPNCNGNGVRRVMRDSLGNETCKCQCNQGWSGEYCDTQSCPECGQTPVCYDVDGTVMKDDAGNDIVCESTPCNDLDMREGKRKCAEKNGTFTARGRCVPGAVPTCECTTGNPKHSTGWTGDNCEIPPNPCGAVDCGDNGHCINGQCACDHGYSGPACEISPRPCDRLDCGESSGRGHCVTEVNAQTGSLEGKCVCELDYSGELCENPPMVCDPNPCQNGTCAQLEGSNPPEAICICPDGYTGNFCEDPPNPCTDNVACGDQGLCVPAANPDQSVGGMVPTCVCLSGYSGPNCTVPPNSCTYPSIRDCSGLGVCVDDATGAPIAAQPPSADRCVAPQGQSYSWEFTNCRDADGNPVRTTTATPKDECKGAGHEYVGDCVNGQCVCNNEDGFQLSPSGLCTGTAGPCVRSPPLCNIDNTRQDSHGDRILESDEGGCRCVCVGPTEASTQSRRGFAAPHCEEVDIHTWSANAVGADGNEATQCGDFGTVVEIEGTKYCAPADMRAGVQPDASGIRPPAYGDTDYAGRLGGNGKFSIPPRTQGTCVGAIASTADQCASGGGTWTESKVSEDGFDACGGVGGQSGVSKSDGTCECNPGYSGDTCQIEPDKCATAGLAGNCQNGGTCIVDDGTARCDCPSGYQGRNCENPTSICDSKDCGGYCSDVSCFGGNDGSGTPCALNEDKTGCAVNGGDCVYRSSPDTGAPNRQNCSGDGKLWTETGYCYPDPADPSRGSCLCTQGYTKPTHPLDGRVVEDRCTVEPNLCDGKWIHGDCEVDGRWAGAIGTKELCDINGGTWHPRGECNPADGSIQCNQITYNLPDGTIKTVKAFRNHHCEDLTSNCLRSGLWERTNAGAGELCNGNGTCIDGDALVPACKDPNNADNPFKPWLLTETACIAGGGVWDPQATCDCFSGHAGNTCEDEAHVCDGQGGHDNCGVDSKGGHGTPTGYCTEATLADGITKVANCRCVGGWTKADGTQGKTGSCSDTNIKNQADCEAQRSIWTHAEPPSNQKCDHHPALVDCDANKPCMGAHSFCDQGYCKCTAGWVFDENGICNTRSNLDPSAGQVDFCLDGQQHNQGYIRQCNNHGSCYEGACHCNDGWSGTQCETPPNGCNSVSCGEHGTCTSHAGNPHCTCPADGSYTMNPQTGQCDVPKSGCPDPNCDPSEAAVSACRQSDGQFLGCDCAPGFVDGDSGHCEVVSGKDAGRATTFKYNCSGDSTQGVLKCDYEQNACEIEAQRCNGHGTPNLIHGSDGSDMCVCDCEAPYKGQYCEQIDPCLIKDDHGGVSHVDCGACGVCVATGTNPGDYVCQCMDDNCHNQDVGNTQSVCVYNDGRHNACASANCGHGACQYDPERPGDQDAYSCVCDGDWGKDAQGHCTQAPCDNAGCGTHGVCFNVGDQAVCQCQDGFLYDTETGTCDLQCPWGTHGAGCQNTYDMCNLDSLPDHVKSHLGDPIGTRYGAYDYRSETNPGGRPSWASSKTALNTNYSGAQAGQGGVCSTEKDSYGNAYPLISCRGVGEHRWMKGADQTVTDGTCVTEFANIRASNPDAATDRDGWISDALWAQGAEKQAPRGDHFCERTKCNKTPCGHSAGTQSSNNVAGQKYGQLTDFGGVTCHDCPADKTINFRGRYSRNNGPDPSVETANAFGCQQMSAGPTDGSGPANSSAAGAWEIGCGCDCDSGNIHNATSKWLANKWCGIFNAIVDAQSGISKEKGCGSVCPGEVLASAVTQSAATENVG